MAPFHTRATNAFGRHPLPTSRPPVTVQPSEAQGSSRPGQAENTTSPPPLSREEAASILVAMSTSYNGYYQPPQSQPPQSQPPQPQLPQSQSLQSPEEEAAWILMSMRTSSNMQIHGHTDGPASPALASPGTTHPAVESEPKPRLKRKGDEETEGEEPETKKPAKAKRGMPDPNRPKPFVCFCGAKFVRNEHLVRHRQCKHGRGRFECDICRILCTRKDNLKQHRSSKHPKSGPPPQPRSVTVGPIGTALDAPATSTAPVTWDGEALPDNKAQTGNEDTQDTTNESQP